MINLRLQIEALHSDILMARARDLARRCVEGEADLVLHLAEIDRRKLYLDRAFSSMYTFCVGELGFSDDAAYNRIAVARAARRFPAILEALRSGKVHLAGLRVLAPHLTPRNQQVVLAEAAGKSKREIEQIAARLAPQPPVPEVIRRTPERHEAAPPANGAGPSLFEAAIATVGASPRIDEEPLQVAVVGKVPSSVSSSTSAALEPRSDARCGMRPLSEETFRVQFTARRSLRDKIQQAKDLLRHRVPDGDLATIIEQGLDLLIERVKKERFAVGRKPRQAAVRKADPTPSAAATDRTVNSGTPHGEAGVCTRNIPDAIKRAVYERDGGRCTFMDERGRRCAEAGALEFDHMDGFARMGKHDIDRIRLLCRAHNQHAAEKMYGRTFMEEARRQNRSMSTRPGASASGGRQLQQRSLQLS